MNLSLLRSFLILLFAISIIISIGSLSAGLLVSIICLFLIGLVLIFQLRLSNNIYICYCALFFMLNFSVFPLIALASNNLSPIAKLINLSSSYSTIFLLVCISAIFVTSYVLEHLGNFPLLKYLEKILKILEKNHNFIIVIGLIFLVYKALFPRLEAFGAITQAFSIMPMMVIYTSLVNSLSPNTIKFSYSLQVNLIVIFLYFIASIVSNQLYYVNLLISISFLAILPPFLKSLIVVKIRKKYLSLLIIGIPLLISISFFFQPLRAVRLSQGSVNYMKSSYEDRISQFIYFLSNPEQAQAVVQIYNFQSDTTSDLSDVKCFSGDLIFSSLERYCILSNYLFFTKSNIPPQPYDLLTEILNQLPSFITGIPKDLLFSDSLLARSDRYLPTFTNISFRTQFVMTSFADSFLTFGFFIGPVVVTLQWLMLYTFSTIGKLRYFDTLFCPSPLLAPFLVDGYGKNLEVSVLTPALSFIYITIVIFILLLISIYAKRLVL